jgi:hypothetical protein
MSDRLKLSALLSAPTGPGRRVPAPRTVDLDWYFCLTTRSLLVPGILDPACAKFGPDDPDPMKSEAVLFLARGETADVALAPLQAELTRRILPLLTGMGGMGGMGGLPTGPLQLQLPLVLRAQVPGGTDMRDSETAFMFARLIFTLPGQTAPPPNHNPTLRGLWASAEQPEKGAETAGTQILPCAPDGTCQPFPVPRGGAVFLSALPAEGSAEIYQPLDESGREDVTEKLRFTWFSTDGQFGDERTGGSSFTTRWTDEGDYAAPAEVKTVQVYIIVQDERGGADWASYALQFLD